jgi:hypothetical protein
MIASFARRTAAAIGLMVLGLAATAHAQTQTVNIQVSGISVMSLAAGTPSLIVSTAVAGVDPTPATATSQYSVTTNLTNQKITAHINSALPAGITLAADLAAPAAGGTSAGSQVLGITDVNLVTSMNTLIGSNVGITYTLSATAAAGTLAATSRLVTYTITTGP